ncbi:hypothetical protein CSPHI_11265 [Corynebacterium sphenisci DSM 44792]|uniref:Uncharacterized protein n=1 Tax=Corynebacterium sphenisci DSM 44792 TaxID=1437874 RepID=A0A1L7D044_9CORY|nr:hypothetical protein [Corynebacterium sphenisci]APT91454.1 hypothetical protein CSPHI_11265 [Corynebacterium sphenisci DSM 44792]
METIVLLLAVLLIVAGVALFILDSRRRGRPAAEARRGAAPAGPPGAAPDRTADPARGDGAADAADAGAPADSDAPPAESAEAPDPGPVPEAAEAPEPEPVPEALPEPEPVPETGADAAPDTPPAAAEPAEEPAPEPEPAVDPAPPAEEPAGPAPAADAGPAAPAADAAAGTGEDPDPESVPALIRPTPAAAGEDDFEEWLTDPHVPVVPDSAVPEQVAEPMARAIDADAGAEAPPAGEPAAPAEPTGPDAPAAPRVIRLPRLPRVGRPARVPRPPRLPRPPEAVAAALGGIAGRLRPAPGGRRARKAWAAQRNAGFATADPALAGQWGRVPEGQARDVVSGFAHGREMHLADVGGTTVLALRRPVGSPEVLEFSRDGGADLREVGVEDGVLVSAGDPELIHRIFDDRAHRVLRRMPPAVTAQWAEGDWAISALAEGAGPADWDAAVDQLAEFADIVRRLPPTPGETGELDPAGWGPTRPAADDAEEHREPGGHLVGLPAGAPAREHREGEEEDPVWRPAPETAPEPVELPTRSIGTRRGEGEFRGIGEADADLPALGEDPGHTRARSTAGRVIREDDAAAADIFAAALDGPAGDADAAGEHPAADAAAADAAPAESAGDADGPGEPARDADAPEAGAAGDAIVDVEILGDEGADRPDAGSDSGEAAAAPAAEPEDADDGSGAPAGVDDPADPDGPRTPGADPA